MLTALLGSLLKEPSGQLTLQAQTENGIVDLLVCDYLGGELRGYVRHDAERLAEAGPQPVAVRPVRQGLSRDHLRPAGQPTSATRASSRWKATAWPRRRESYFAQSEQIPSLVRLAAEKRDGGWIAGGLLFQHLPEGEEGRERLHTRLDHPDWPHVAVLAGSVKADELTDPGAAARRPRLAAVPRGRRSADARAAAAVARAAAATPIMCAR